MLLCQFDSKGKQFHMIDAPADANNEGTRQVLLSKGLSRLLITHYYTDRNKRNARKLQTEAKGAHERKTSKRRHEQRTPNQPSLTP